MRVLLGFVVAWLVAMAVAAALWSTYPWWVAILIGVACGFPVLIAAAWWAARTTSE